MKKLLVVIASAIIFGGIAGGMILGITHVAGLGSKIQAVVESQEAVPETAAAAPERKIAPAEKDEKRADAHGRAHAILDVSDIVEEAMPQVVSITNTMVIKQSGYSNFFDYFYGGGISREYEVPATGSGVILEKTDDELLIVTNNHVIQDSKELSVTFIDGESVDASIKGADSSIDLAVIAVPLSSIKDETLKEIEVAKLHDTEDLKVGQGVIAIGNALGYGQTVTVGYISALEREIQAENSTYSNLIQIDAAINPGNSGGALLNMDGEVIGINVAKLSTTAVEGMGYSIPIYKAFEVIQNLSTAKTKVALPDDQQGRLGIYMNTVSQANAQALGIPAGVIIRGFSDEETEGYSKDDVMASPAKEGGLLKNDIITKFDGQNVTDADQLAGIVKYYEKGSTVEITVQRPENGAYVEKTFEVTLGSKKDAKVKPVNADEKTADKKQSSDENADAAENEAEDEADADAEDAEAENGNGSSEADMYELFREFFNAYR